MSGASNSIYDGLIEPLIQDGYLKTPEIIEAFKRIDRADFVPEEYKADAYVNAPLPIGFGQTISQPLTVAFMLELLEPKVGEKILDIGAGSGWKAALLAYCVSQYKKVQSPKICRRQSGGIGSPKIITVERVPELAETAKNNIAKYNFIKKGIVEVILGDGSKGNERDAPYDKIIAGAAAKGDLPEAWREQLKIGGRIVAPVENSIVVVDKVGKNEYNQKEYFGFSFVPLI